MQIGRIRLLERDTFDLFLSEFDKPWVIHLRETYCCSTNLCTWRPNTVYKNRSVRRHHPTDIHTSFIAEMDKDRELLDPRVIATAGALGMTIMQAKRDSGRNESLFSGYVRH
jgi:hypothetical protein